MLVSSRLFLELMVFLYQKILKPILFLFSPEVVHKAFVWLGEKLFKPLWVRKCLGYFYGIPKDTKPHTIDGIQYASRVGLAAGFDYNGKLAHVLPYMGFGFEEVGSVTARPCEGNPRPRLTRLIQSRSILVYKGLRNDGVEAVSRRLKKIKLKSDYILGISIAKTNDALCATMEGGIDDYASSLRYLVKENLGAFYTINVSCPNVHGGEDFAVVERLRPLLEKLKEIPHNKPMYVKLPINKTWDEFSQLLDLIKELGYNGVVIGNLNKDYDDLKIQSERPDTFRGGLSGLPCQKLSTELIRKTRERFPNDFTIFGCGGILSAEDAIDKIHAGADLVQLITGMIYNGPHLMGQISQKLNDLAKKQTSSRH
jgi:dihydroorotate dehydrogenase